MSVKDCLLTPSADKLSRPTVPVNRATRESSEANPLRDDLAEIILSASEIQSRVEEVAAELSIRLAGKDNILILGVLTGAFIFTSDLVRHLSIPAEVKFVKASSYGTGTVSSGTVSISEDSICEHDVYDKTVVVVEDIVDTGNTLKRLLGCLRSSQPRDVISVCLLDKPSRRQVNLKADITAFEIPDKFVVGYGLDFAEQYRCLPYIGVLKPEKYQ
eukprot:CAMPEP_0177605102 /NCGR_PEP_ID=MMETSP0419_2-20121207/16506_1 /TAXON_ID=582737 /ORGANISM="Tetraselmis sp., Strain GSL018" /LENGTH=215 /DNA_ID=CAMNT_0019099197 /DNA_START=259 /DNA_END=906 /DNA_ORIENTATION=+